MAPSGTWWTTLGPDGVSDNRNCENWERWLALLGIEFAVEDGFDHDDGQGQGLLS